MSSILKVDQLQDSGGNALITSDGSGNITTQKLLYPAFEAYLSADQSSLADNVATKLQANTEVFDTDSCYDNSTNYRFTPTVAGRYFVYHNSKLQVNTTQTMGTMTVAIRRNGSELKNSFFDPIDGQVNSSNMICCTITYMNGTSDYLEAYGTVNATGGNQWRFDAGNKSCTFGAYRIGD
jgi:hypothetical protein